MMKYSNIEKSLFRTYKIMSVNPALEKLDSAIALHFLKNRDHAIFLCSYPKSGRTWLRFLITKYQFLLEDIDDALTMANFARWSPNLSFFSNMRLSSIINKAFRPVYGTHSQLQAIFNQKHSIFLIRDMRDILVSYFHHQTARGLCSSSIDDFVLSHKEITRLTHYFNYVYKHINSSIKPPYIVKYEDLKRDPHNYFAQLLANLDFPLCNNALRMAIEFSSFNNMKKIEAEHGHYDFKKIEHENHMHVRKGKTKGFLIELKPDTICKLNSILSTSLHSSFGYTFN